MVRLWTGDIKGQLVLVEFARLLCFSQQTESVPAAGWESRGAVGVAPTWPG